MFLDIDKSSPEVTHISSVYMNKLILKLNVNETFSSLFIYLDISDLDQLNWQSSERQPISFDFTYRNEYISMMTITDFLRHQIHELFQYDHIVLGIESHEIFLNKFDVSIPPNKMMPVSYTFGYTHWDHETGEDSHFSTDTIINISTVGARPNTKNLHYTTDDIVMEITGSTKMKVNGKDHLIVDVFSTNGTLGGGYFELSYLLFALNEDGDVIAPECITLMNYHTRKSATNPKLRHIASFYLIPDRETTMKLTLVEVNHFTDTYRLVNEPFTVEVVMSEDKPVEPTLMFLGSINNEYYEYGDPMNTYYTAHPIVTIGEDRNGNLGLISQQTLKLDRYSPDGDFIGTVKTQTEDTRHGTYNKLSLSSNYLNEELVKVQIRYPREGQEPYLGEFKIRNTVVEDDISVKVNVDRAEVIDTVDYIDLSVSLSNNVIVDYSIIDKITSLYLDPPPPTIESRMKPNVRQTLQVRRKLEYNTKGEEYKTNIVVELGDLTLRHPITLITKDIGEPPKLVLVPEESTVRTTLGEVGYDGLEIDAKLKHSETGNDNSLLITAKLSEELSVNSDKSPDYDVSMNIVSKDDDDKDLLNFSCDDSSELSLSVDLDRRGLFKRD